jgi:hypothetical protein
MGDFNLILFINKMQIVQQYWTDMSLFRYLCTKMPSVFDVTM